MSKETATLFAGIGALIGLIVSPSALDLLPIFSGCKSNISCVVTSAIVVLIGIIFGGIIGELIEGLFKQFGRMI